MSADDLTPNLDSNELPQDSGDSEEKLLDSYDAPTPRPEFVASLGERLSQEMVPPADVEPLDHSNRIIAIVLAALAACVLFVVCGIGAVAWYLLSSSDADQIANEPQNSRPSAEPATQIVQESPTEMVPTPTEPRPGEAVPESGETQLVNTTPHHPTDPEDPFRPDFAPTQSADSDNRAATDRPGTPVAEGLTGRPRSETPTDTNSNTATDKSSALRYGWKPGKSYAYNFSIEAKVGEGEHTSNGRVTYTAVDPDRESSVTTTVEHATGSGFAVSSEGHLVTCAHVVRGATRVDVKFGDQSYVAQVLALDKRNDLALLKVDAQQLGALDLGDSDAVELAQDVRVVGYPLTDVLGSSIKVTRGTVSGIVDQDDDRLFQVDAPINAGNSGGPVVNASGHVVGVASAKLSGEEISNIGFAVPVAEVRELLEKHGVNCGEATSSAVLEGPELARQVTPSVALLEVTIGAGGVGLERRVQLNYDASMTTKKPSSGRSDPRDPFGRRFGPPGRAFGPRGFPGFRTSSPTKAERGQLQTDVIGETYDDDFDLNLPFLFGPVALLAIDPLGEKGESSWYRQRTISLIRTKEEQQDNSPFGRMHRPPFFHDPFAPREEPRAKVVGVTSAFERYDYEIGETTANTITVKKRYNLKTLDEDADPKIGMNGAGEIVFDRNELVPKSSTFTGTFEVVADNVTLKIPVTFTYSATDPNPPKPTPAPVAKQPSTPPRPVDRTLKAEHVDDVLKRLASTDQTELRKVLSELGRATPGERRKEVAQAIEPLLKHEHWPIRQHAASALEKWAVEENTVALVAALRDDNFGVRRSAIKALAKLPSKEAAEAIVAIYAKDAHDAKGALIAMGPVAEETVLTLLQHDHWVYRGDACEILGKIGSEKSVPSLTEALKDGNGLVPRRATDALAAINKRAGKPPAPEVASTSALDKRYRGPGAVQETGRSVDAETELYVGQILLVRDSNAWYPADVVELLDEGRVRIHFRGWSSSWDKAVARSVLQLAPDELTQPERKNSAPTVTPQANRKMPKPVAADDSREAEEVLRSFLQALTSVDREAAQPLLVAATDDDVLWAASPPDQLALPGIQKWIKGLQFRALKVGETIDLPGNRMLTVTARHVNDDKRMLTWDGNPVPFLVVKTADGWRVDARSIVAARRAAAKARGKAAPK